jgi:[acyl-carrier-protein] S-malonyltransferase
LCKAERSRSKKSFTIACKRSFPFSIDAAGTGKTGCCNRKTKFRKATIPVYQNITTTAVSNPDEIKKNLIAQLTGPVKWTQSVQNMIKDGASNFVEVGPGKTSGIDQKN